MERIIGIDRDGANRAAVDWVIRRASRTPAAILLVTAFDTLIGDPLVAQSRRDAAKRRIESAAPGCIVPLRAASGAPS